MGIYKEQDNQVIDLSGQKLREFQAHKDGVTSLSIMSQSQNNKLILTSGNDQYVKVWDWNGQPKASVNINHPLPIQWDIDLDIKGKLTKNIIFSLKVVELIFRRHRNTILMTEERLLSLNNFLSSLIAKGDSKFQQIQSDEHSPPKRYLMKDEYMPRDL